jgi:hypothetical protein
MNMRLSFVILTFFTILFSAGASAKNLSEFEPQEDGIYNYCPAAFEENGVRHIYYCTNTKPREVTDSIAYRTAVFTNGKWAYSNENIVLEHTKHWVGWDTVHVCDPDVVKGQFTYQGEDYSYLMAYLGCTTTNNQNNEIGLAVSKEPGGPFLKINEINPIVSFKRDCSTPERNAAFQWGVGQPSLISLDKAGKVLLLYTMGGIDGTFLIAEKWNFCDLEHPLPIGKNWREQVSNAGLIGRDKRTTSLNNAEAVYEPENGNLYLIADGWPHLMPSIDEPGAPDFISATVRLLRFSPSFEEKTLEDIILRTGEWTQIAELTPSHTGFPRNHNAGLVHDPYGWALQSDAVDVLYSVSEVNQPSHSLWTYRIHMHSVHL